MSANPPSTACALTHSGLSCGPGGLVTPSPHAARDVASRRLGKRSGLAHRVLNGGVAHRNAVATGALRGVRRLVGGLVQGVEVAGANGAVDVHGDLWRTTLGICRVMLADDTAEPF